MRPGLDRNSNDSKLPAKFFQLLNGMEMGCLWVETKQLKKDRVLRCLSSNSCVLNSCFVAQQRELS